METLTLKLRGKDENGGELYRSYYLVTDGGNGVGRGRASVIPMSRGAPMPPLASVAVSSGGEQAALSKLLDSLLKLPGNQGLEGKLDDNPS